MADNVAITAGSGTSIATDDVGGVQYQRVKVSVGADGSATDVSAAAPIPTVPGRPVTNPLTTAAVSASSSGDNTLVSATASQTTRVFRLYLVAAAAVSIKLISGATDLTGVIPLTANGALCLEFEGAPHFVTGTNEAFILNLSSAVAVTGWIGYEKSA
ncbi:MAG: hypothetical protein AB7J46_06390 [Candidatus Altimarinota bacterium]